MFPVPDKSKWESEAKLDGKPFYLGLTMRCSVSCAVSSNGCYVGYCSLLIHRINKTSCQITWGPILYLQLGTYSKELYNPQQSHNDTIFYIFYSQSENII